MEPDGPIQGGRDLFRLAWENWGASSPGSILPFPRPSQELVVLSDLHIYTCYLPANFLTI